MLYYSTDDGDALHRRGPPKPLWMGAGYPLVSWETRLSTERRQRELPEGETQHRWRMSWGGGKNTESHGMLLNLNLTSAHFLLCDGEHRKGSLLHRNVYSVDF